MKGWLKVSAILVMAGLSCQEAQLGYKFEKQPQITKSLLIGLDIFDHSTVWASGTDATVIRTLDGGSTWQSWQHQEDSLQFRDIHAISADDAIVMSAGPGRLSQIWKLRSDSSWRHCYTMDNPRGFLDAIAFWDDKRGLAYGDAIDRKPFILKTKDGGLTWSRLDPGLMPDAGEGEGGFAASGTCIATQSSGRAWIGTGAGGNARVLYTPDFGESWFSYDTPMIKGEAAGITSIRFLDDHRGLIAGGDLALDSLYTPNIAFTSDGGQRWSLASQPITRGAFYGSAFQQIGKQIVSIVCGPNGADISLDQGRSWTNLTHEEYWTASIYPNGTGWLMGRNGNMAKIIFSNFEENR
ncbi:MAG: hypothetical protein KI790_19340 [Cyclobacteriaceae bacterium]|nr:hypothetical protein [Cyclobacteriaceae bacterium HetDA_MAG_MS6]